MCLLAVGTIYLHQSRFSSCHGDGQIKCECFYKTLKCIGQQCKTALNDCQRLYFSLNTLNTVIDLLICHYILVCVFVYTVQLQYFSQQGYSDMLETQLKQIFHHTISGSKETFTVSECSEHFIWTLASSSKLIFIFRDQLECALLVCQLSCCFAD